ncbi:MAG: amidohydrolase family protein [Acidimicrobiia bacterium]
MARLLVISADTHTGAPQAEYLPYLDPEYRQPFETALAADAEAAAADDLPDLADRLFTQEVQSQAKEERGHAVESTVIGNASTGSWDPTLRLKELEADGCVGDVLFPGGLQKVNDSPPFAESQRAGLRAAGLHAYNRWLADLCSHDPARHAGVALVDLDNIDRAVEEIRWAKDAGLRGGILLPASTGELPPYNHPRYEPIWQTCAELEQPVNVHSGDSPVYDFDLPGAMGIFMTEVLWFAHRPLWYLLWAGVFERHPTLKFALVEQGATWVPDVLDTMDMIHGMDHFTYLRDDLPLKPIEYWHRQCFVNGGLGDRRVHDQVGIDNLMWGSDYPHFEGTWPHSKDRIADGIVGMPRADVDKVLGGNAARVYGFDLDQLAPIAAGVGPEVA